MNVQVDVAELETMKSLLGDQFDDTLSFCFSELERLHSEFLANLEQDKTSAVRHIHSLKSNAAQFGARSLAQIAKEIEIALSEGSDPQNVSEQIAALPEVIQQSIAQMRSLS